MSLQSRAKKERVRPKDVAGKDLLGDQIPPSDPSPPTHLSKGRNQLRNSRWSMNQDGGTDVRTTVSPTRVLHEACHPLGIDDTL